MEEEKQTKKEKWISKENCCYITNTGATEKAESSEEHGIILNCIPYQDWVGWIGWRRTQTRSCVVDGWLRAVPFPAVSREPSSGAPGAVCSGSSEIFLQQSSSAVFCSPQDLLASGSAKAKLSLCVPCSVPLRVMFSAEPLVVFPKQRCAFGDYPPQNRTRRGLANSLHMHVPKPIYMRHINQVITRTQVPAHATVGSILFLKRRHCPLISMVSTMQSLLW